MRRRIEALVLLASLGCMGLAGLAGLLPGMSAAACCGSPACCQQKACPMKAAEARMPSTCPMRSDRKSSTGSQSCLCLGPQPVPSTSLYGTGHFDFRFDLPRTELSLEPPSTPLREAEESLKPLAGFSSLPEQPPETRL